MEEYLAEKNISMILKDLVLQLGTYKPENAVQFMIEFLSNKYLNHNVQHCIEKSETIEKEADFKNSPLRSSSENVEQNMMVEGLGQVSSPNVTPKKIPLRVSRRGAISSEPPSSKSNVVLPSYPKNKEQQQRLETALSKHIMFAHLEEEERQSVFNAMFEISFKKGEEIIRQGNEGDNFYVIENGECDIYVNKDGKMQHVAVVGKDGSFGELALIYGSPRAATVLAKTDVTLWALDRNSYRQVLMNFTIQKRKMYESFLERIPLLAELTPWERMTIADALEIFTFQDEEIIIKEGEFGDRFYIIVEGEAEVLQKKENGSELIIATLHKADYFGEVALLTNRPRAATVRSIGNLKCVGLDRARFNRVLGPCENILRRNMQNYNRYLADKI